MASSVEVCLSFPAGVLRPSVGAVLVVLRHGTNPSFQPPPLPCPGVGLAYDYVGTKDSIMIRISDLTVTTHLLDMTGPLAITSANPSGQPDSTHHDMVVT